MTDEQLQKIKDAIGDGSTWPKFTDDPEVNYEIDRLSEILLPWAQADANIRQIYIDEAKLAFPENFGAK